MWPRLTRVAISLVAALLGIASTMSQPAAQALGPDEAHDAPARVRPVVALSPAQKCTIYNAVSQQRLRTSPTDIPLVVGALVSRSAMLLMCPMTLRALFRRHSSSDTPWWMTTWFWLIRSACA
jgi:hypothetical protein